MLRKTLAATLSDSAPLARIIRCISTANSRTRTCITPEVVENRHQRRDENDDGQDLEGDQHAGCAGTEHRGDLPPRVRVGERTEDERGADACEADEAVEPVSRAS